MEVDVFELMLCGSEVLKWSSMIFNNLELLNANKKLAPAPASVVFVQ
jgi:hypothetical protein